MTNRSARAFLMLSLNLDQVTRIKQKELALPPGRCLTPYEISKFFNLKTGPKDEKQIAQMEALENEFHRQEWKRRKIEDIERKKGLSEQEEMHEWDNYVMQNWDFSQDVPQNDY